MAKRMAPLPQNVGFVSIGWKMSKLGEKVRVLSELADKSVGKASAAEEESMELEGTCARLASRSRHYVSAVPGSGNEH